ncbi:hypothetical protein BJV82DRAFT_510902 [Fennellomyces sp. T-0311]|nr:hypothetical protein BJV82DRAFT_510902 [Fennellomyces sp. T-0311]
MSEREFQNMFIFSLGFEAASLKWHCKDQEDEPAATGTAATAGKKQMIGFARFRTRLEALEAVEVLNGKRVDQERGTLLKAEMAKKNLHIKRGSTIPAPTHILSKKMHLPTSGYDSFSPLPSDLLSPADYYKTDPFMKDPNAARSFNPADQNPPCNTLYVGNLPPNTSEDELRQLFAKCRAFKRMSFRNKAQGPMCFVEFEDVVYATQAMSDLQGYCLSNSVKGGIRLSFSKNPLFTKPNKDVHPSIKLLGSGQRDFVAFETANCT